MATLKEDFDRIMTAPSSPWPRQTLWRRLRSRPRLSALIEILFFTAVCAAIDQFVGSADRFISIDPHPFWIIVLLISLQYGTNEGIIATVFSSAYLLLYNLPPQSINQSMYEYLVQVIYRPILWTLAAVVIGEMTARLKKANAELLLENRFVKQREQQITKSYKNLKEIKEGMETRMVGQLRSSIDSFNAMRNVNKLNPVALLRGISEVVRTVTAPEQFSVYIFSPNGFELIDAHGWEDEHSYPRGFGPETALFVEMSGAQRIVCAINPKDADLLDTDGIMCGPLIDPINGMVFGMIKIERLDFMALNATNVETFKLMLDWAGATFSQARQFQKAYGNMLHSTKSGVLSSAFYKYYTSYLRRVRDLHQMPFFQLVVKVNDLTYDDASDRIRFGRRLVSFTKEHLPNDMLLFAKKSNHTEFALIPMGANKEQMQGVANMLQAFLAVEHEQYPDLEFEYEVSEV